MSAEAAAQFVRDCQSGAYERRLRTMEKRLAEAEKQLTEEMKLSETRLLELGAMHDRLHAVESVSSPG